MNSENLIGPSKNPLENPKLRPAFELIRKVVFSRDKAATHISKDDLKESLRFLNVTRKDARNFFESQFENGLPPKASAGELTTLLALDNSRQQKLFFEPDAGRILRQALVRFDVFITVPEQNSLAELKMLYSTFYKATKGLAGQESAARQASLQLATQLADHNRKVPANLLLHGPNGCGTQEMAIALSKALFKCGYQVKEVNCAQYRSDGEAASWHGSKPYWQGSQEGLITSFIYANPKSVVIFHNLDRTLPKIMESLTDPLTTGIMVDQFGIQDSKITQDRYEQKKSRPPTTVDCSQAVFLFTVSEGSDDWYRNPDLTANLLSENQSTQETIIRDALREAKQTYQGDITPVFNLPVLEVIGQHLVLLRPQQWAVLRKAAKKGLQQALRDFKKRFECTVLLENVQAVADTHLLSHGANQSLASTSSESFDRGFLQPLSAWLIEHDAASSAEIILNTEALTSLKQILENLGSEPLETLSRRRQVLRWNSLLSRHQATGLKMTLSNLELHHTKSLGDFTGEVKIEAFVPDLRFSNVVGHEECKKFLSEVIGYLRQPEAVTALGIDLPKGAVLVGPPGTGKTRLAQAFAGEAGLPILATTGPDLLNPALLGELYRIARRNAPCLIFVDEADALRKRGQSLIHDAAINKLLTEIQGFSSTAPVFHMLATNRAEMLDEALTRPGRIDRRFHLGALNQAGREVMTERLLKICQIDKSLSKKLIAKSSGMTGAGFEQVIRECGLRQLRSENQLTAGEVFEEIDRVKFGPRRDESRRTEFARQRVALHEIGHALCHHLLIPDLPLEIVTIVPRDESEGFIKINHEQSISQEETPKYVHHHIAVLLAGRAAEMIKFGNEGRSGGATSDLKKATRAAHEAVAYAGLDDQFPVGSMLGYTEFDEKIPESVTSQIWERTQHWLQRAENEATQILRENWLLVEHLTEKLLIHGTLDGIEFSEYVNAFRADLDSAIPTSASQSLH